MPRSKNTASKKKESADSSDNWLPVEAVHVPGQPTFVQMYAWAYVDAVSGRLEAYWYLLYTLVISNAIKRTENQKTKEVTQLQAMMALGPQYPFENLKYGEQPVGNADENNIRHRYRTRNNTAQEFEPTFESISQAPSHVQKTEEELAQFSARMTISDVEPHAEKDRYRFPDFTVRVGISDLESPVDKSFVFTEEPQIALIWGTLAVFEIKRLPDSWYYDLKPRRQAKARQPIPEGIRDVLLEKMRQQVFEQVQWAFAHNLQQQYILHISCVGDYCIIRVFKRDMFMEALEHLSKGDVPDWHEITSSEGEIFRLIDIGAKDLNPEFKRRWTVARKKVDKGMRASLNLFSTPAE